MRSTGAVRDAERRGDHQGTDPHRRRRGEPRPLLRKVLKGAGYLSVATTTNPEEAVDLYKEFQPDLIVLDLHMRPIDGFQILDQLKASRGPTPTSRR